MARTGQHERWAREKGLIAIATWARLGLTDFDIAKNIGIHVSTLYEWKKKYQEIADVLKNSKEEADAQVENALYKSACGYDYTEITEERVFNQITQQYEMVVTKKTTKHYQPSNTAQIFWLKNRQPESWRDRQEINLNDSSLVNHDDEMKPL